MKPFLKWAGGKTQLLPEIRNRFVVSKKYCEPFIGGGAVLFDLLENNSFDEIYISDVNRSRLSKRRISGSGACLFYRKGDGFLP